MNILLDLSWLPPIASCLAVLGGAFAIWVRARDRDKQRKALAAAANNPELQRSLTESLPPITPLLLLVLGASLLTGICDWTAPSVIASRAKPKCSPTTCKPPSRCDRGICVGDGVKKPSQPGPSSLADGRPTWIDSGRSDPFEPEDP